MHEKVHDDKLLEELQEKYNKVGIKFIDNIYYRQAMGHYRKY